MPDPIPIPARPKSQFYPKSGAVDGPCHFRHAIRFQVRRFANPDPFRRTTDAADPDPFRHMTDAANPVAKKVANAGFYPDLKKLG